METPNINIQTLLQALTGSTPGGRYINITTSSTGNSLYPYLENVSGGVAVRVSLVGSSFMTNPMTTQGDIIVGGVAGAPERLAIGTANQMLGVNAGATTLEYKPFTVTSAGVISTSYTGQTANAVINGFSLVNATAASSGNQQYSPYSYYEGKGWKTDATAASQPVAWRHYVIPAQGTTNPTSSYVFENSINSGAFNRSLQLYSDGSVGFVGSSFNASVPSVGIGNSSLLVGSTTYQFGASAFITANRIIVPAGSSATPSYSFGTNLRAGLFGNDGSGTSFIAFTTNTTERMRILDNGTVLISGAGTASTSSILQIDSTTQTLVIPRMTTAQRNAISSPLDGSLVYDDSARAFFGRQNGAWVQFTTS